jgi:transposase
MSQQHPIPEPLWGTVPAETQTALLDAWKALHDRIAELESTVRDLQARLQLNSTNSSKPPSSDPIGLKRKPPTPPSRRKRGGQPGHRKAFRALVPPEKLRSSTDCKPDSCRGCGHALHGVDPTR